MRKKRERKKQKDLKETSEKNPRIFKDVLFVYPYVIVFTHYDF